jgi:hypothetical protein
VRSKADKLMGKNPTHGQQPAKLYRDPIAPSIPPETHKVRAKPSVETVGWKPDGSGKHVMPSYPNASRGAHGLDGHPDLHATTDGAQGQAHSASGGAHGKPSPHPTRK